MWSSLLKTWTPIIVIKNAFSSLNADGDDIRTIRRTTQKGKAFKTKITWLCFYALLVWKVIVLIARLHRPAIFGKARVGHWYRYDSPDSGVQTMSFFFFASPTWRWHDSDTACHFLYRPYLSYFGYTTENSRFWPVNLNRPIKKK